MSFDQGEFDFDAGGAGAGWAHWREELDRRKREFESRWGVVLGRRVTVSLRNIDKPFTGKIEWLEEGGAGARANPKFQIGTVVFSHADIESIAREDDRAG